MGDHLTGATMTLVATGFPITSGFHCCIRYSHKFFLLMIHEPYTKHVSNNLSYSKKVNDYKQLEVNGYKCIIVFKGIKVQKSSVAFMFIILSHPLAWRSKIIYKFEYFP